MDVLSVTLDPESISGDEALSQHWNARCAERQAIVGIPSAVGKPPADHSGYDVFHLVQRVQVPDVVASAKVRHEALQVFTVYLPFALMKMSSSRTIEGSSPANAT